MSINCDRCGEKITETGSWTFKGILQEPDPNMHTLMLGSDSYVLCNGCYGNLRKFLNREWCMSIPEIDAAQFQRMMEKARPNIEVVETLYAAPAEQESE